MSRCLCEWKSKEIEKNLKEFEKFVKKPEYICRKCGRCANSKKVICKPVKM